MVTKEPLFEVKRISLPSISRLAMASVILGFASCALCFCLSGFCCSMKMGGACSGSISSMAERPESVHEVKIRAERRKGVRCTADEGGKDTVRFQPSHP